MVFVEATDDYTPVMCGGIPVNNVIGLLIGKKRVI